MAQPELDYGELEHGKEVTATSQAATETIAPLRDDPLVKLPPVAAA